MRINQISRKYGLDNKSILEYLESIGVHGKSHSSSLDDGTIELLLGHFNKLDTEKKEETATKQKKKFARIRRPKGWKPQKKEPPATLPPSQETAPPVAEQQVQPPSSTAKLETPPQEETSVQTQPEATKDTGTEQPEAATTTPEPQTTKPEIPQEEDTKPTPPAEPKKEKEAKPASKKKVDSRESKKDSKTQPKSKRARPKSISLEKTKQPVGEPEIIIETSASDLSLTKDSAVKEKGVKQEPEAPSKHDQDEAIRREIQRLKAKQKHQQEGEEEKSSTSPKRTPHAIRRKDTSSRSRGKRAWKREKRERREQQIAAEELKRRESKTVLKVHEATTVADIAEGLGLSPNELIQKLISLGVMASINQQLDKDTIHILADEYGFQVEEVDLFDSETLSHIWEDDTDESRMVTRPPVVTIMGHVDHGKTKLLDAVRSTDVVSSEAGGITQHIGAYYVKTEGGDIVFLDTPGHEAFTAMRARGATVTDIVILVVSAADGVMPQTVEAINHAKAAGVPILVAINKIDMETANIDRLKQQLAERDLLPEDWGGKTVMVPISAKQQIGIEDLLETLLLQAELMELKADPECRARGTIIESRLEQGRGSVATVLIQQGTLRIGEPFVTGIYSGRVRAMVNDKGEPIDEAGPAYPVEIVGMEDVPSAGDPFMVVPDESQAKQISARLQQIQRERELKRTKHISLDDLHSMIEEGEIKELRIIVKGDVQGSVGAVCQSLNEIESDKVRIEIIHSGVGAITESDVMLASASNAIIIGFNVRPYPHVSDTAKREHVDIRTYRVIYNAIQDVKQAMTGMLDKTYREKVLGHGEIREVFKLSRGISIAGSYVQDGRLMRNAPVRLLRDSVVIHEGKLSSLKRFKDDVKEVPSGYECGIGLEQWNDIRVGDVVECYELEEVAPVL